MSNDATELDDNPDIRVLRENAAKAKELTETNAKLARELLFAKAGIETGEKASRLAKMLFDTFDGDDPAKLVEAATEIGLLKAPEKPKDEPHPDARQQATRDLLAGGDVPGADPGPDPWDAGYEVFYKDRSKGVPIEQARLKLADRVLTAAARGDHRVRFDKRAHQEAAAIADELAML